MQPQPLPPNPGSDSPPSNVIKPNNNNNLHHHHHHPNSAAPESLFNTQNTPHNMYNIPSEYSDLDPHNQQPKVNGFGPTAHGGANAGPYRTSTAFNAFSNNRMRNQHAPTSSVQYRDNTPQPSSFNQQSYPTAADVFPVHQMTSPTQQHQQAQQYDIHQGQGFEYAPRNGPQGNNAAPIPTHTKQSQYALDPYATVPPSALMQNGGNIKGGLSAPPPGLHPQQQQASDGYQVNNWNGLHIQSQTPYGPHLQTAPGSAGPGPTSAVPGPSPNSATLNGMSHLNGANGAAPPGNAQEEISTIFVVGFPEDMQEREFQNMFTFSAGFEAATLKIPNKEYTAYGGPGGTAPPGSGPGSMPLRASGNIGFGQYGAGGTNDPYNLVTVNQGGVVVDGGRDGTTASWPSSVTIPAQDALDANGHFGPGGQGQNAMPPRKQIIGFAKFRSRQEALDARDVLQGRRVDIEKGAVLKAEMAKKNLHTKRGVGLMGVGVNGGGMGVGGLLGAGGVGVNGAGGMSSDAIAGLAALNMNGLPGGAEVMSARERELGALGAMGFGGLNQWREPRGSIAEGALSREDEERERRRERDNGTLNAMGLGSATRGPRERAEDDEREREKRRKEKEARLRSTNSNAFDAFHSVPPQSISRATSNSNSLLVPSEQQQPNGVGGTSPLLSNGYVPHSPNMQQDEYGSGLAGPWGKVNMTTSVTLPARPPSTSRPSSPPGSVPFSPSANSGALPSHHSLPIRPRPFSPSNEGVQSQGIPNSGVAASTTASVPPSSASSNAGESQTESVDEDMMKALSDLAVSTGATGNTSPQLPSPGSAGSAGGAKANVIDQNPPINTLYVGNLPTTQVPQGYPTNYLEDSLRELFQRRPGYRKLCFRQKSNGPMCFVEFEDVHHAAKALNELYGNNLNGLIKGGGIRLSYSKNPLGVRTPTSAGGTGPTLQQQQQQNNALQQGLASPFPPDAFNPRHSEEARRRDMSNATSPHPGYNGYTMSPPPPRFFSPPPASSAFNNTLGDSTPAFTRVNNSYFPQPMQSSFSPFGISTPPHTHANIPESTGPELEDQHYSIPHRALSPPANSIEVARAG